MRNVIIILVSILLAQCGRQNSNDSSSSDAAMMDSLTGTWEGACSNKSKITEIFENGSETRIKKDFSDDDCKTIISTLTVRRTYTTADNKIDIAWVSLGLTINSETALQACQENECYGSNDWTLNVERDITGSMPAVPKKGDKGYSIFKVEGSYLTFGKLDAAHDGMSEASRPTEYSDIVFTKKK